MEPGGRAAQELKDGRLPPIGFWSYSRQDDQLSGGKLSSLRALLMSELQQQYGRERIQLFQDVSAIPHGAQWENEIRNALANSTFFIPIVTPNFIQSEWCSREVELFLEREEGLVRDHPGLKPSSRIFPLHLIDIAGSRPHQPAVLAALEARQWFDYRGLRHRRHDDEAVREALAEFAGSIRSVLQLAVGGRKAPVTPPADRIVASPPPPPLATTAVSEQPTEPLAETDRPRRSKLPLIIGGAVALVALALLLLLLTRSGSAPAPNPVPDQAPNEGRLATAAGPGVTVAPQTYQWLLGNWGYGNCYSVLSIEQSPAGITIKWGSGGPTTDRVTEADATHVRTREYRFVRDEDGVQWYSGEQMLIRLVPCPNGELQP